MLISPYLFFNGSCEEALAFYQNVFGGDVDISRYEGTPMADGVPDDWKSKVIHATLTSGSATFMASDVTPEQHRNAGRNISLCITAPNEDEADRVFAKLSEGGSVTMPLEKTFWGAKFGMLIDKYGFEWMVNARS